VSGISSDTEGGSLTCPNAPPDAGSALFGVVQAHGQVAYLSPIIPVTTALIEELKSKGVPIENRFRFTGPCMADHCEQWRTDRCALADAVIADIGGGNTDTLLPHCGIRASCRWFFQHRQAACGGCPIVIRKPAILYEGIQE
jgi:hypothetical protein